MSSGFAKTLPSEQVIDNASGDRNLAKSMILPFDLVAQVVDLTVPLRRPKKTAPSPLEAQLQAELDAWDAASDEALEDVI